MYHRLMLQDIEEIALEAAMDVRTSALAMTCDEILPGMRAWLERMTHPDGRFALFQDSAFNGFPGADVSLPVPALETAHLSADSGYFTSRWGAGHYLAVACGEPGPAHQTGHAHADALSFELSLWGERWIVDTGCGSYQNPEIRAACRSSGGHNLPLVAGCEQTDVWGEFRMGRRCRVVRRSWDASQRRFEAVIEDAGGNRLSRLIAFEPGRLVFEDRLEKRAIHGVFQARLHLAPGTMIEPCEGNGPCAGGGEGLRQMAGWSLRRGERTVTLELPGQAGEAVPDGTRASLRTIDSCYYPMFGPGEPNTCLILETGTATSEGTLRYVLRYDP